MTDDILELSALPPEREKVRLRTSADPDGTIYEMIAPDELGAVSMASLGRLFEAQEELWNAKSPSAAEQKRLAKLLDDLASRLIPDAPREAVEALGALAKRALVLRFFVQAGERVSRLLPASWSPDSSDSTGASRPDGSK